MNDAQRVKWVKKLIDAGFSHRIMLAHDIHTKHRLVSSIINAPLWRLSIKYSTLSWP